VNPEIGGLNCSVFIRTSIALATNPATCYSRTVTRAGSQTAPTDLQQSVTGQDNWSWFIWVALAVLLAYPLSLGPVAKLYDKRPTASVPPAARTFYAPLGQAYDRSKEVKAVFDWYVGLWGAHL